MIRYRTTCGPGCQFVMCLFIILASCRNQTSQIEDLSKYYLPLDSFPSGGVIYTYRNMVDTALDREVWKHVKTSKGHITSINYDRDQQVVQEQFEKVVSNGVLIDSLVLYYKENEQAPRQVFVKVLSPHRFPFDALDSSRVWLTHLEWYQPGDSLHVVLERRRRFMGDTLWSYEGQMIPAIKFNTHDKFETEEVGWTSSEWSGEEVYAENIGLIYYRRNISEHLRLEFELESIKPSNKF